jgi:hypothetical protein
MGLILVELLAWSKHLRENFDKILLVLLVYAAAVMVIHMSHDAMDKDNIAWGREITGTVLGGLMGLVTGRAIGAAQAKEGKPDEAEK